MSSSAHETTIEEMLADGSDLLVKVVLTGPRWVSGDTTAKYPSLDVSVMRIEVRDISDSSSGLSAIAESPDREPSARSQESNGSINANPEDEYRDASSGSEDEQRFDSDQLYKLLTRQLEREIAGSYKTWAKGSDSLKGGCCPHHRDHLETFLETTTYDVVRNMMWIEEGRRSERRERPEWLKFQAGGQIGDSAEIDEGYTTTKPGSDIKVSDFPCEYTTAGGSLWDNCLVQSAVGRANCQFPLSELLQKGILGLDIEASMKTPAPLFTDLRAKWTVREGSLDITTPEIVDQLGYLEPISTAYINEVKKEVSYMRGWSKETHRTNLESAMTTAKGMKNPSRSHWQVPYPFSVLKPKLAIVERESRSRSSK